MDGPVVKLGPEPTCGDRLQSICVRVWLIVAWVWAMVSPRFPVRFSAASWFAAMPAGMAIIMAMEKLSAIMTSRARILRLAMFLNALDAIPVVVTILWFCFCWFCLGFFVCGFVLFVVCALRFIPIDGNSYYC